MIQEQTDFTPRRGPAGLADSRLHLMVASSGVYPIIVFAIMIVAQFFLVLFGYSETQGLHFRKKSKKADGNDCRDVRKAYKPNLPDRVPDNRKYNSNSAKIKFIASAGNTRPFFPNPAGGYYGRCGHELILKQAEQTLWVSNYICGSYVG
jgi:hypothetical protein